jgi:hypothetical protein
MNSLKQKLLTNWHFMRLLRLGIGLAMLVMGIQSADWLMGVFSTFFLYQAVTDTGCCGTQGCAPARKPSAKTVVAETVTYEEIK